MPQIVSLMKRQTVRADRPRHARPGEAVQLYQAMRTKDCRKIILDPVCTGVLPIEICVSDTRGILWISIDGDNVEDPEAFASADGFHPAHYLAARPGATALENMARFWLDNHEAGTFRGVLIRWEPSP
nr:ASCH domain-containing protein [uncultured Shinella sp.]